MDAASETRSSPTRIITYSLRAGARNSDAYYRTIERFAADWTAKALHTVGDVAADFRAFRRTHGLPDRTDAECAFELLVLGVLLYEHGAEAVRWPRWLARWSAALHVAQKRWPAVEGLMKTMRGWSAWLVRRPSQARLNADAARLLEWLRANGESARAERLAEWQAFFDAAGSSAARRMLVRCLSLAASFGADSSLALGEYTAGVNAFLAHTAPGYRGRYDGEFVSRTRLEYHLGLLGTEVLSRAYRQRFLAARRKIVIVPPCLRAQPEAKCQAVPGVFGARCQGCTPACRVHQVTKLGEKHGFEVYIVPDELRVFGAGPGAGDVGVVGVSCALTNWSGGWEADHLGIAAQGVLLDYVGCLYHWDPDGIPTDTNLRQLEAVVRGT